jgi:uncharacterized protein YbaP (TraB family)
VKRVRRLLWASLFATLIASGAAARSAEHHALWEVHGAKNTVYLLGSIHLLRPQDSELPAEVLAAYRHAGALLMEIDPRDIATDLTQPEAARLMLLPAGQTLDAVVGPRLYGQVQRYAAALGLGKDGLQRSQPWYAATAIDVGYLMQLGFDPEAGVDRQLARMADRDNKPILPLETTSEQLGFFAAMPLTQQRAYLRDSLRDLGSTSRDANATVRAWRRGDVAAMERDLRTSSRRTPDLHPVLVADRNRRWLPQILDLLDDERDYLVVVGAMHIVGHDGLLDLLRQHGYNANQR